MKSSIFIFSSEHVFQIRSFIPAVRSTLFSSVSFPPVLPPSLSVVTASERSRLRSALRGPAEIAGGSQGRQVSDPLSGEE